MKGILELLEIDEGLYIIPSEISEITIIKDTKRFSEKDQGHSLITMKHGGQYMSPVSPIQLFERWAKSGAESGFGGVDIYSVYKEDEDDDDNKDPIKVETK